MTRNFKTLEVGKYYVSYEDPDIPVKIVKQRNNAFEGSNGKVYRKDGRYALDLNYDRLITEVTVTNTPVEPKKPRECWRLFQDGISYGVENTLDGAKMWAAIEKKYNPSSVLEIVHMREVMEGEE